MLYKQDIHASTFAILEQTVTVSSQVVFLSIENYFDKWPIRLLFGETEGVEVF